METIRYYRRIGWGLPLDEVALLLKLGDGTHCEETRELAERKLVVVERKLADLTAIRDVLGELIAACRRGSPATGCSIIESLARNGNIDEIGTDQH